MAQQEPQGKQQQHHHHHEVVIVGGGTAGLYCARRLIERGVRDVVVLESRPVVGGRVSTTRDPADGQPLFNNFAWRISETNPMMLQLCRDLDIELIHQTTPPPEGPAQDHGQCKHGVSSSSSPSSTDVPLPAIPAAANRPPLSDFAAASLRSTDYADRQDRESGYAGRTGQIAWPHESHGTECWIVKQGMDTIPATLAAALPVGTVRTNVRATNVAFVRGSSSTAAGGGRQGQGQYSITAVQRNGRDFTPVTFTCNQVVLAVPPYSIRGWTVAASMQPALYAVHERRLGHVYAKVKTEVSSSFSSDTSNTTDRIYQKLPDSILQQNISGDYGRGIFQAGYACDRFERVWRELQYQGPTTVFHQVQAQLDRLPATAGAIPLPPPAAGWKEAIDEVYVRIGFVHRWHIEAHVCGKTKEDLSLQALSPNENRLPGLYLIGEAFSPHQGWTEGALWTAERASARIVASRDEETGRYQYNPAAVVGQHSARLQLGVADNATKTFSATPMIMTYKGLVVDVNDWFARHPGGVGPIQGHAGEDISDLFDNFHGGWPAPLATLFGLQIGIVDDDGDDDDHASSG
jgi:Flavin containing amine oxidoreductase/Cytochrome b5-like Heme/Steroid binding domain